MICLSVLWGEKVFISSSPYSQSVALWGGRFMEGSLHKILSLNSTGLCPQSPASHGTVKTEAGIHLGGNFGGFITFLAAHHTFRMIFFWNF